MGFVSAALGRLTGGEVGWVDWLMFPLGLGLVLGTNADTQLSFRFGRAAIVIPVQ